MDYFSLDHMKALADEYAIPLGINLLIALLVFFIGRRIARLIVRGVDRIMQKSELDEALRRFVGNVIYGILYLVVIITALERLGVKTTAAIAVLGAAGLAVGLALQGSLGNFASGVMIILFKPYRLGDVVTAAGHTGKVEEIQIFNTILITPDNRMIIVPNGQITGGSIENMTTRGTRRVDMTFGIGYGDDISKARGIIESILAEDSRILADPKPDVAVAELADSSVNFIVRPWVNVADYWGVKFDTTEKIKRAFDDNGVSIPFPQTDVHLHKVA